MKFVRRFEDLYAGIIFLEGGSRLKVLARRIFGGDCPSWQRRPIGGETEKGRPTLLLETIERQNIIHMTGLEGLFSQGNYSNAGKKGKVTKKDCQGGGAGSSVGKGEGTTKVPLQFQRVGTKGKQKEPKEGDTLGKLIKGEGVQGSGSLL